MLTALLCRHEQGKLHLRIDDYDKARTREAYIEDILRWTSLLDFPLIKSIASIQDFYQNHSSQKQQKNYQFFVQTFKEHFYYCTCSRKEILSRGVRGYDGYCRDKEKKSGALRFKWSEQSENEFQRLRTIRPEWRQAFPSSLSDPVLIKKDGQAAYLLASLIDDMHLETSHLVRGADLIEVSVLQQLIASQLSEASTDYRVKLDAYGNMQYFIHPVLTKTKGEKLSKSVLAKHEPLQYKPIEIQTLWTKALEILTYGEERAENFSEASSILNSRQRGNFFSSLNEK